MHDLWFHRKDDDTGLFQLVADRRLGPKLKGLQQLLLYGFCGLHHL